MEAAASDAARSSVATGNGVTDLSMDLESEAHSRRVQDDDIVEIYLVPTPGSSTSSPQPPPQARRSMRRASRTRRNSYSDSVVGESQGAAPPRPDRPASPQSREAATSPTPLGQSQGRRSIYSRIRTFLGHGNPSRRRIVHTIFSLTLYLSQIVISAAFIALTQTKWSSQSARTRGGIGHLSEWDACDKPLGSMMIVWLVRCILGVPLTFWSFKRSATMERREAEERASRRRERRARRRTTQQAISGDGAIQTQLPVLQQGGADAQAPAQNDNGDPPQQRVPTEWDKAYDRAISITSLLAITHFLITNVLIFSSTKSCRVSSPHLWWSTFAMLCLTYIIILEVLIIGFTIFIIMPIIFIGLNILLIMTGHRPISARQIIDPGHINPETPKMPQKLVDKIPLVLYIPAPSPAVKVTDTSSGEPDAAKEPREDSAALPVASADHPSIAQLPLALLRDTSAPQQTPHFYPPDTPETPSGLAAPDALTQQQTPPAGSVPGATSLPKPHPRFAFFRRKKRSAATGATSPKGEESEAAADDESEGEWENRYVKSSLPFVRLENNRATCAICLMDFDEPPRKKIKGKFPSKGDVGAAAAGPSSEQSNTEPEPLRLLECGHVFHKSCLDPWLTGVSGRCPTCQRKVEIVPKGKRKDTPAASPV